MREAIIFLSENAFSGRIGRTFLLALILFLIGVFANAFGIDIETTLSHTLAAIDCWLDVLAPWLDMAGKILFRLLFALIFIGCVVWGICHFAGGIAWRIVATPRRRRPVRCGGVQASGSFLAALVLGYFASFGMFI